MMTTLSLLLAILLPHDGGDDPPEAVFAVKAAKVFTAGDRGVIDRGVVLVRDGRIAAVGRAAEVDIPAGAEVLDLGDLWLTPGLHEPHCHAAGSGSDLNDMVYLTNPELHADPAVIPDNDDLRMAQAGGVTTVLFIPGSGTNMGGFGVLTKTAGDTYEEMLVRSPGSLKVAQAGNPERYSWFVGRALMNWNTRDTLEKGLAWARDYAAGAAEWDPGWSGFDGLLDKSVPVSVHTQIYQVVLMTIMMQKRDLGLDPFIDHGTFDGYKTAPLAAEYQVPVMNGPRQFWFDRSNARVQGCTAGWAEQVPNGLILGYNTDSPVVPQEELSYQAAMGVRLGHDDPYAALEGITSLPAKVLKCDDVSGRLEPGLEADFVAWSGFPIDPRSHVEKTWVRGKLVYDAERDGRRF